MTNTRWKFTNNLTQRIFNLMKDGAWRTVQEVAATVDGSETSTSASIRNLRKPQFGGHVVECIYDEGRRNYLYRLQAI